MLMAEFNCPYCGSALEAAADMDGETHACPRCDNLVTLQVVSTKEAVKAGLLVGGLAALAAIFFGGDN